VISDNNQPPVLSMVDPHCGKWPEWGQPNGGKPPRGTQPRHGSNGTLRPGPFAGESIRARGPETDFTAEERREIDRIGAISGCHTCGVLDPGTLHGHFIPDHQKPSALNGDGQEQRLYPHCNRCSRLQGGEVSACRIRGRRGGASWMHLRMPSGSRVHDGIAV
jgi:hypothetical protein